MPNLIGPLFIAGWVVSLIGIVLGLARKKKKTVIISLVVFAAVTLVFFILEGFLFE